MSNMKQSPVPPRQNRRRFLKTILATSLAPLVVPPSVLGRGGAISPNNRIVFGVIGFGNRAKSIIQSFMAFKEVQMVAISDCRTANRDDGINIVNAYYNNQDCVGIPDFRDLLARKDIDATFIATGMRWHGLASIYAARAGKDIYCEKPIALSMNEGRLLEETCKRFGTIYQAGTQRRGTGSYKFARQMVLEGKIGALKKIEMQLWTGGGVRPEQPVPVPEGWDWDMWLGQTPWKPFTWGLAGGGWHYFWDTAEGAMTDMGCHYTDQMQWVLGTDHEMPVEYTGQGVFPDPKEFISDTPLTGEWHCRYANGVEGVMYQRLGFEDRYITYIGEEGWIRVDDQTDIVTSSPDSIARLRTAGGAGWDDASSHIRNLLDCIRTRKQPDCNPTVARHALGIAQAWNLALRLNKKLSWNNTTQRFDDETASRMMYRQPRAPWVI